MTDVVVVGGGLAGLVTAHRLAEADLEVSLFEANDEVGGRVRTTHSDGYTFDRGFQVLFPAYPAVRDELDIGELDLQYFRSGAMLVSSGERSILGDPFDDPMALTPTILNRNISIRDKLRTLTLRRSLAGKSLDAIEDSDDKTIDEALDERGFSDAFQKRFAAPLLGGITLDRTLSDSAFVFEYVFKMLAAGGAAVPANGMAAIPLQIAEQCRTAGVSIECEQPVTAVRVDGEQTIVETPQESITADVTVIATDPQSASKLTDCHLPTECNGCVTQYFTLPKTQQLSTDRRFLLNIESARPNHVALLTDIASTYAPKGSQLLSATFLNSPDGTDGELGTDVRSALESWFPENNFGELELLRTERIPFGQLKQPPGFLDERPTPTEPTGSVYLAGDYLQWSSIQGAIESGQVASRAVLSSTVE